MPSARKAKVSCIVLQSVDGGRAPMTSPPWKHVFDPPPTRSGVLAEVRNCAVDASILVLSTKPVLEYADVITPVKAMVGPVPVREGGGGVPGPAERPPMPSLVAVTVAAPSASPMTRPLPFTDVTATSPLAQVTGRPGSGVPDR